MASRSSWIIFSIAQKYSSASSFPRHVLAGTLPSNLPCLTSCYSTSTTDEAELSGNRVTISFDNGLPKFLVPLPSRQERCVFTLKPLAHSVGDLLRFISEEDKGVDRAAVYAQDGVRLAKSNSIESLLQIRSFSMQINDKTYQVDIPSYISETKETVDKISDLKNVISQLHMNLNIEEYQLKRERELIVQMESIQEALVPFEQERVKLANKAAARTRRLTWCGLGAMGLQFGLLARLTWWEYSWDIMEPVTYFVGYGTAMVMYSYYVVTREEYTFPHVFNREYLKKFYSDAQKSKFDIDQYNDLRTSLAQAESDLKRLRDPLLLNLPLQQFDQCEKLIDAAK